MSFFSVLSFVVSAFMQVSAAKQQKARQAKAKRDAERKADAAKFITIQTEGSAENLYIPYGRNKIGGVRVYHQLGSSFVQGAVNSQQQFVNGIAGTIYGYKHEYLTVQQAIAVGQLNYVYMVDVNDLPYYDAKYNTAGPAEPNKNKNDGRGGLRIDVHLIPGVADSVTAANYPDRANASFPVVSNASAVYRLNRDDPQFSSAPNSAYYLEGNLVHTLVGSKDNWVLSASKVYSNNPAYVLLDYLVTQPNGRRLNLDQVDLNSFKRSADICDIVVISSVPLEGKLWTNKGGTRAIKLYECNIALPTSETIRNNIESLLETMGMAELIWSAGKYKLSLEYPTIFKQGNIYQLGAVVQHATTSTDVDLYQSIISNNSVAPPSAGWSSFTRRITDDDIMRGGDISMAWPAADTRYNYCTVTFGNESKDFSQDTVSWPPKTNYIEGPGLNRGNWNGATAYNRSDYSTYGGSQYQLAVGTNRVSAIAPNLDNAWIAVNASDVYRTFLAEDNGIQLELSTTETGCSDYYHALAKAEQRVRSSRASTTYTFILHSEFANMEPGDFVRVVSTTLLIPGEILRVENVKLTDDGKVEVTSYKFDASILAWNAKDNEIVPPRNIYDNALPQATNLRFTNGAGFASTAAGLLEWDDANDVRIIGYQVMYTVAPISSISSTTLWTILGVSGGLSFDVQSMPSGVFTFTVVSMAKAGLASKAFWPLISSSLEELVFGSDVLIPLSVYKRTNDEPPIPIGGAFNFDTRSFELLPPDWTAGIPTGANTLWLSRTIASAPGGVGIDDTLIWEAVELVAAGAITALPSRTNVGVLQDIDGNNYGYANAFTIFIVIDGAADVTASSDFSLLSYVSCTVTVDNTNAPTRGTYQVTELIGNTGSFVAKVLYKGIERLVSISVAAINVGFALDLTPPPDITDMDVETALNTVFFSTTTNITYPQGHGHAEIIVYGTDKVPASIDDADVIGSIKGQVGSIASGLGRQLRLWFKNKTNDGVESENFFGGVDGINGATGFIESNDLTPLLIEAKHLQDGSVTAPSLAANSIAVGTLAVQNGAIVNAMISNLNADKIRSGEIMASELIDVGSFLRLNGNGSVESFKAPNHSKLDDYSRMSFGEMAMYMFIPALGQAVRYSYLARIENGTAANGALVAIPGYWKSQPNVLVSINSLKLYDAAYKDQSQTVTSTATDILETSPGSRQYTFVPRANLSLAGSLVSVPINQTSGATGLTEWTSAAILSNSNVNAITAFISALTVRGNGASQYYRRKVTWYIEYSADGVSYTRGAANTLLMGDQISSAVSANATVSGLTARAWYWRVYYVASDTDGSVFGGISYNYTQTTITGNNALANADTTGKGLLAEQTVLATVVWPAMTGSGEVYQLTYNYSYSIFGQVIEQGGYGTEPQGNVTGTMGLLNEYSSPKTPVDVGTNSNIRNLGTRLSGGGWTQTVTGVGPARTHAGLGITTATYPLVIKAYAPGAQEVTFQPNYYKQRMEFICRANYVSPTCTIYRRTPAPNSTTPNSTYNLISGQYSLATATILATGILNWFAMGY